MEIYLYETNKKRNSTYIPQNYYVVECDLKDNVSKLRPVLTLIDPAGKFKSCNYCYIPVFARFYWITEIEILDGFNISITCEVDPLASYKNDILDSTLYVLRSSSTYDNNIIDLSYPTKINNQTVNINFISPFLTSSSFKAGSFIFGMLKENSSNHTLGAITYDLYDFHNMTVFIEGLMKAHNALDDVKKSLFNPLQYVKSCMYIPIPFMFLSGNLKESNFIYKTEIKVHIPSHPQAEQRGWYLNTSPFSEFVLNFPPFGSIPLNSAYIVDSSYLTCSIILDVVTGFAYLELFNDSGVMFNRVKCKVGTDVPLAQVSNSIVGFVGGLASSAVSGLMFNTNPVKSSIGVVNGITSALTSLIPRTQTLGSSGEISGTHGDKNLACRFNLITDEDLENNGRPCMKKLKLASLSGFCQVQKGEINVEAMIEEKEAIKNYLESGFYIE